MCLCVCVRDFLFIASLFSAGSKEFTERRASAPARMHYRYSFCFMTVPQRRVAKWLCVSSSLAFSSSLHVSIPFAFFLLSLFTPLHLYLAFFFYFLISPTFALPSPGSRFFSFPLFPWCQPSNRAAARLCHFYPAKFTEKQAAAVCSRMYRRKCEPGKSLRSRTGSAADFMRNFVPCISYQKMHWLSRNKHCNCNCSTINHRRNCVFPLSLDIPFTYL